ncbi:MAG: hypothetical protein Kow0090_19920 [Myxococcota bacterium]
MQVRCYKCDAIFEPDRAESGGKPEKFTCPACGAKLSIKTERFELPRSEAKKQKNGGDAAEEELTDATEKEGGESYYDFPPEDRPVWTHKEPNKKIIDDASSAPLENFPTVSPVWENREGKGIISSWFATLKMSVFDSYKFFYFMPRGEGSSFGNFGYSVWFLGIVPFTAFLALWYSSPAGQRAISELSAAGNELPPPEFLADFFMGLLIASPILAVIFFYGLIGLYHINLVFLQSNKSGFYATFRSVVYGSWPVLLLAVPLPLLPLVAILLCLYTHTRALSILHRIPVLRALLGVFLAWVIGGQTFLLVFITFLQIIGFTPDSYR